MHRKRSWLPAVALAAVLTGSGSLAGPVSAAEFKFNPGPWLDLAGTLEDYIPFVDRVSEIAAGSSQLTYSGKLTVLLVGSDWRPNSGERLDTILVVSINTSNKLVTSASIPRDMARIPIPPSLGGGTYKGKINGMFTYFRKQTGTRQGGLERFRLTVAYVLGIKIDYVAYTRFSGFDRLVDEVGGVWSNIPAEIRDPKYIDKPGWPTGAKFLADTSALLKGGSAPRCYGGYPKPVTNWGPVMNCTRAIVYVRSRKGTIGSGTNNDYKRAARQQKFVFEAIKRVTNGFESNKATALRNLAYSMPSDFSIYPAMSAQDALSMYSLLKGSTFAGSVVFSPPTYASHISGTSSNQLKLDVVRSKCNSLFDGTYNGS